MAVSSRWAIEKLQDNRLPSDQLLQEEREIFVVEMKKMYKLLTDRQDSLLLLQGYSYAEFLQWKLDNDTLLKKAAKPEDKELIQAKFDRDKNFLEVLIESTGFLSRAFDRMADNAVGECLRYFLIASIRLEPEPRSNRLQDPNPDFPSSSFVSWEV